MKEVLLGWFTVGHHVFDQVGRPQPNPHWRAEQFQAFCQAIVAAFSIAFAVYAAVWLHHALQSVLLMLLLGLTSAVSAWIRFALLKRARRALAASVQAYEAQLTLMFQRLESHLAGHGADDDEQAM